MSKLLIANKKPVNNVCYVVQHCEIFDQDEWDADRDHIHMFQSLKQAEAWARHMRKHPSYGKARVMKQTVKQEVVY